ncbi:MAG: carboxypeptidase-like regulatory domain-containing protein [Geobacteraceae bacterium]|nr:carboxypeptidase-like regulatory domain-containing protein [Geobacteraceae bacterium]
MKKFLYLLLAIAMLATFGCTGDENTNSVTNPNPNPFQPKGTVTGVLVDACTNEPIANAVVYIMDKKATTNSVGMFTIKDVPANTAVGTEDSSGGGTLLSNGLYSWQTYNVVIDMSAVNKERAKIAGAALYPSIAYHTVQVTYTSLGETSTQTADTTTSTNHDTPVDGFVANIKPRVGKLSATMTVEAVDGRNGAVIRGTAANPVKYELISLSPFDGINTPNNVTGNLTNIVQVKNDTTGLGRMTFTGLEASHIFYARITWTDPNTGHVWTGRAGIGANDNGTVQLEGLPVVWTECDGSVSNFVTEGPNPPVKLFDKQEDNIAPYIESVTPANLTDIGKVPASGTQNVVFTFSEVLKPTQYILNTTAETSTAGGIYNDINVTFDGPKAKAKAGNIPYTLTWDSVTAPRVLTVTIPVDESSRYTVDMTQVIANANVMDTNGNLASDADTYLRTPYLMTTFTTSGTDNSVAQPAATRLGTTNTVQWLPISHAIFYRIYIAEVRGGVTYAYETVKGNGTSSHETAFTTFDTTSLLNSPPFNDGEIKISYLVKVVAVNSDGTESTASAPVTIDDKGRPTIVSATGRGKILADPGANATISGTLLVTFSEVMNKETVNSASAYSFTFSGATTAVTVTFGTPTITYDVANNRTLASVPYTIATGAGGSIAPDSTVSLGCTGTDLNGNTLSNVPFVTAP